MMKVKLLSAYAGHGQAGLHLLRLRVECLAELHDVEAALAERRTDRWRRIRLAGRHLQLDVADDFLCHVYLLLWVRTDAVASSPLVALAA